MTRSLAALNTVPATNARWFPHAVGWLLAAAVVWLHPGLVAADTKHDLVVDPGHFLTQALSAYSEVFPFGQVQNQAFGYLFPQGLFFLLTPGPTWVVQRLWWWLLLGVGFSGMVMLCRRVGITTPAAMIAAATVFTFSPHTWSVLSTISSEAWPVMLTPWMVAFVWAPRTQWQGLVPAATAALCMGAVNATATVCAILPAVVVVATQQQLRRLVVFCALLAGVCLWWIIPLLVLGAYAVPFTEFIESAWTTTRFSNVAEVLRGANHWVAFISPERAAGHLIAANATWVVISGAIAACGIFGLSRKTRPAVWSLLLVVGLIAQVAAHGPFGEFYTTFLDGAGVAFRNVHKWDVWVRLPLALGVGWAVTSPAITAAICGVCLAPANLLLPIGAYQQVPPYVAETANFVNTHAKGRVLILPASPFAQQDWGWTRDEPLQPLLRVPWAVRDAIPLVDPDTIRGLDGLEAVLESDAIDPVAAFTAPAAFGIGTLVVREDIPTVDATRILNRAHRAGLTTTTFGAYHVIDLAPSPNPVKLTPTPTAGGGEAAPLIQALTGAPIHLVSGDADIVTDTPARTAHNYGAVDAADSSFLTADDDGGVHNRLHNYPTVGAETVLEYRGGHLTVSSSAADVSTFAPDAERAAHYATDGDAATAWYPRPGARNPWLALHATSTTPELSITITGRPARLVIQGAGEETTVDATPGIPVVVPVPGGPTDEVRISIPGSFGHTGIAEAHITGAPITPHVVVPAQGRMYVFQRLMVPAPYLSREFSTTRPMRMVLEADHCGVVLDGAATGCGVVEVPAGRHELHSPARWVTLREDSFSPQQPGDPWWMTGLSDVPGLEANVPLFRTGAGMVGAESAEAPQVSFAGDVPYRVGLFGGWVLAAGTLLVGWVRRRPRAPITPAQPMGLPLLGVLAGGIIAGIPGVGVSLLSAVLVLRWPKLRAPVAASSAAVAVWWLAHGPAGTGYAGDGLLVALAGCSMVAAVCSTRE